MSYSTTRCLAFAAAITLAPTVSFAQEVFGNIHASLDGEDHVWFLTTEDDNSLSFGLNIAIANLQSVSLWGQPTDDSVKSLKDSLLLTFDVMSVGDQLIPLNASLTFLEQGWKSGWIANEEDKIVFSLVTIETTDDGLFVEGSFEAEVGFREPLSNGQIDESRSMQIDGKFSATLPPFLIKDR